MKLESRTKGLLIDLDGVIYQGNRLVPGAGEAVAWMTANNIPHVFLTNTTSKPISAIREKLHALGVQAATSEILTPAVAARSWLETHASGPVALFVPEATRADYSGFEVLAPDVQEGASAVVLGDIGRDWTFDKLNRAFRLLMGRPQPALVALGMTRYWQTDSGLQLDVGPFVRALEYAAGCNAVVLGKPSPAFFGMALQTLNCGAEHAVMIGDDLVGDVHGAQDAGIRGILVRTGKFRPSDLEQVWAN